MPAEDPETSRKLILATNRPDVSVVIVRAADVPTYVQYGAADVGVAGKDVLLEHGGLGLYQPLDLEIAACRMVVATKRGFDWPGTVQRGARIRVATKYVETAREHFGAKGMHVDLIKLYGSMELAPLMGLADVIVDLVASGNTLKANDLVAGRGHHADQRAAHRQSGGAQAQARRPATIPRGDGRRGCCAEEGAMTRDPLALRRLESAAAGFDDDLAALIAFEAAQDREIDAHCRGDRRRRPRARRCGVARVHREIRSLAGFVGRRIGNTACRNARRIRRGARRAARGAGRGGGAHTHVSTNGRRWRRGRIAKPTARELGQQVTPLDRVGVYVPGGKAAYPSSVLMNAIPAHVAGVAEIVMVVPAPDGVRNPLVLAAAHLAGVSRAFTIGGAQAIAALAYGTATIPAVDKICGPGNAYVAAAKRRVFGTVGIDMVAGASEILVIADATAHPDWVAMDLFSQAEHDELAQAILVTPDAAAARGRRGERRPANRRDAAPRDHRRIARATAAR